MCTVLHSSNVFYYFSRKRDNKPTNIRFDVFWNRVRVFQPIEVFQHPCISYVYRCLTRERSCSVRETCHLFGPEEFGFSEFNELSGKTNRYDLEGSTRVFMAKIINVYSARDWQTRSNWACRKRDENLFCFNNRTPCRRSSKQKRDNTKNKLEIKGENVR